MRQFRFFLSILICVSCNQIENKKEKSNELSDSTNLDRLVLQACNTSQIVLDTLSSLTHKIISPDSIMKDLNIISLNANNDFGYAVIEFEQKKYLSLIIGKDKKYEILGTARMENISPKAEIVNFCQSSCKGNSVFSAYVIEEKDGKVRTVKAWKVNEDAMALEEVNPDAVDCTDSFYNDYD
jgi:hypothetical protein